MRYIILFLFLSSGLAKAQCDIDNLIHPEFDKKIIAIWTTDVNSAYKIDKLIIELKNEWSIIKSSEFYKNYKDPELLAYVTGVDQLFTLIKYAQRLGNYKRVKDYAYQLQNDTQQLRSCLADDVYSLDLIWLLNTQINSINSISEDPMMDLLEFNEFQKLFEDYKYYWSIYEQIPNESIQHYFPDFNFVLHNLKKNIANNCINEFENALNTAMQNEFKMPCNDLLNATKEILAEYGKGTSTSIN